MCLNWACGIGMAEVGMESCLESTGSLLGLFMCLRLESADAVRLVPSEAV